MLKKPESGSKMRLASAFSEPPPAVPVRANWHELHFPPRRMRSVQSLKLFKSSCTQLWTHSCDNVLGFSVDLILTCSIVPRPTITTNRQSGLCQLWPQVWQRWWKQHWHQSYHCSRGGWKSDTLDILACNYRQSSSRLMRPGRATYSQLYGQIGNELWEEELNSKGKHSRYCPQCEQAS